jgi:hypothetical protein
MQFQESWTLRSRFMHKSSLLTQVHAKDSHECRYTRYTLHIPVEWVAVLLLLVQLLVHKSPKPFHGFPQSVLVNAGPRFYHDLDSFQLTIH